MSDTLTELHQERLSIQDKMVANEKTVADAQRSTYWLKKRLRVVEAEIREAEKSEPTSAQVLSDLSSNGLK